MINLTQWTVTSNPTRMIKNLEIKREVEIKGILYTATKSKETRNKILALASTKDSQEIAN